MKITLNNYEVYALAYLDGELSAQEDAAFTQFLNDHPEVREELAGMNTMVLVPDKTMVYPDKAHLYRKETGGIIPLVRVSRLAAAAVALLLVSATAFFIWKSGTQPDNQPFADNSDIQMNQPTLPVTRIPVPENDQSPELSEQSVREEQPGTQVMAHQGNVPGRREKVPSSPALTSGNTDDASRPLATLPLNSSIEHKPFSVHTSYYSERIPEVDESEIKLKNTEIENSNDPIALSFLPKRTMLAVESSKDIQNLDYKGYGTLESPISEDSDSFKIHIPGEFLSDTWADVSVSKFKKKLIPQFIKNQLNL